MMLRTAVGLLIATCGCSMGPRLETRAYSVRDRDAEVRLIHGIVQDEIHRVGLEKFSEIVNENGGRLRALEVTDGNVAIVRTTPRGHRSITRALNDL